MNKKDIFNTMSMIDDDLIAEAENAVRKTRRIGKLKIAAIAAAVVMILGITAIAATIIFGGSVGHSTNIPSYYSVPDSQTLLNDIGIAPKVVSDFSGGYSFKNGYIIENEDYDTNGNVVEAYKVLNCQYKKGKHRINLYIDANAASIQLKEGESVGMVNGSELLYDSYMNKMVPSGYKMTEQDKSDEASGKYVFSYGSNEIRISEVQCLAWKYNGLNYALSAIDNPVVKEELIQMAKEVIDIQGESK